MVFYRLLSKLSSIYLIFVLVKDVRGYYLEPRLAQSFSGGCKGNLTGFVINEITIECVDGKCGCTSGDCLTDACYICPCVEDCYPRKIEDCPCTPYPEPYKCPTPCEKQSCPFSEQSSTVPPNGYTTPSNPVPHYPDTQTYVTPPNCHPPNYQGLGCPGQPQVPQTDFNTLPPLPVDSQVTLPLSRTTVNTFNGNPVAYTYLRDPAFLKTFRCLNNCSTKHPTSASAGIDFSSILIFGLMFFCLS